MRTSDIVAAAATRWPERTALVFGDRRWTFREFDASAARQAAALSRRGGKAGGPLGLLVLVLDPRLEAVVDAERLELGGTEVLVVGAPDPLEGAPGDEAPGAGGSDSELAVIFFSSGSTGNPKGIAHSHRNLGMIAEAVRTNWRITAEDSLLVAMPLAFVYASVVECLTAIGARATITLHH